MKSIHTRIGVITPSIRQKGIDIVRRALEKQSFVDFDWYICSPFDPHNWATWIPDEFKYGYWTLNRAYNAMIKRADCDLIVSWQDFTHAGKDTLKRFWKHFEFDDHLLVGAWGNKYEDESWSKSTWEDPRPTGALAFGELEWNLCSCPKKALIDTGGFCEDLDFVGFGMDGFNVNQRLSEMGYKFYVDRKIESFSLGHGRVEGWDENNLLNNGKYLRQVQKLKAENRWPVIGKI